LASQIVPLCVDGTLNCPDQDRAIVFLFFGFSNCDIEICGGNSDAWDGKDHHQAHLQGQPCSTRCPNLHNPDPNHPNAWNDADDGITQHSFLYEIYHPMTTTPVGPHVVVFNGALGQQTLDRWDPIPAGYYWTNNNCDYDPFQSLDPECNYYRVKADLQTNGYSEKQVQAVFLKASNPFPQCDLKGAYCAENLPLPKEDAYLSELHMGNILRYLKCCKLDADHHSTGVPRYPNLKQVFITSRIYGGYANGQTINGQPSGHNCLMPEPFAFEEGFAVQRTIVAQIDRTTTDYAGDVRYPESAPWVDWGPYLWASGAAPRNFDGLNWCNGQASPPSCVGQFDVRFGDPDPLFNPTFWGDFTHPTAQATQKVANQLLKFVDKDTGSPWVRPWIVK
jgi:hypothetical protein